MGVTVARKKPWVLGIRRSGLALGLAFLIWVISVHLRCCCRRLLWWLLRKYWGRAKWRPDPGSGSRTPSHSPGPARGLSLCLRGQREAGRALVPWKITSVMATHSLQALPVYLSHSCLSVSLCLSLRLSHSSSFTLSFCLSR